MVSKKQVNSDTLTIAIKTCKRYKETRLKACEDTWLEKDDLIVGDLDEFDVDVSYQNLIRKTKRFFLTHKLNTQWLFWCDDDTFVNRDKIIEICKSMDASMPIFVGKDIIPTTPQFKFNNGGNNPARIVRETCLNTGILISRPMFNMMQMSIMLNRAVDMLAYSSENQWLTSIAWDINQLFAMYTGKRETVVLNKGEFIELFELGVKKMQKPVIDHCAIFQTQPEEMYDLWEQLQKQKEEKQLQDDLKFEVYQ